MARQIICTCITPELLARIDAEAARRGLSRSAFISLIMTAYLDGIKRKDA